MKPYAPDIHDPFPKPTGNGGHGGGNGGGNGNNTPMIGFVPGQIERYVQEQVAAYGGDPQKWRQHFKAVYSPVQSAPDYSWEKGGGKGKGNGNGGGNNGGGGNNPGTGPGPGGGGFDPASPRHRMAPMDAQMPMQGLLNTPGAFQQMPPTFGLLRRPAPSGSQPQLPPEIMGMLARR